MKTRPECGRSSLPRQFSKSNREVLQVADVVETYGKSPDDPVMRAVVQDAGLRTMLYVPLYREDVYLGRIVAARREVSAHLTDKQVALLQAFAAQAVLAMENARLLTEQREALEQQTATAEILRAISQSPTDVQPVLDAVAKAALRFCGATDVMIQLRDADSLVPAVHEGPFTAPIWHPAAARSQLDGGRAVVDARTIHIPTSPRSTRPNTA